MNQINSQLSAANPSQDFLDALYSIALGERVQGDILDAYGVVIIPANTKLSKTRLQLLAGFRGQGVRIPASQAIESAFNSILIS